MISPYDMSAKAAAAALEERLREFEITGRGLERDLAGEIASLLAGVLEPDESYELGFSDGYQEAQADAREAGKPIIELAAPVAMAELFAEIKQTEGGL